MQYKFLLLVLLLGFSEKILAQRPVFKPGYLVKTNGDTLRGLLEDISAEELATQIRYKTQEANPLIQTFYPNEIAMAYISQERLTKSQIAARNKYLQRIAAPAGAKAAIVTAAEGKNLVAGLANGKDGQRRIFLQRVVQGMVTLYLGAAPGGQKTYYLQKGMGAIYPLTKGSARGLLQVIFDSCQQIPANRPIPLQLEALTQRTLQYNLCKMPAEPVKVLKTPYFAQVSKGFKIGLNQSAITFANTQLARQWSKNTYPNTRQGLTAGMFFNFYYGKRVSLQPELLFAQKGGTMRFEFVNYKGAGYIDHHIQLHFLQLPLMGKYQFHFKKVQPYIIGGPEFGWLLSSQVSTTKNNAESYRVADVDVKEMGKIEMGLMGGAGLQVGSGAKAKPFVEIRYNISRTQQNVSIGYQSSMLQLVMGMPF